MTSELEVYPVCDEGKLHPKSEITYHNITGFKEQIPVVMKYSVCDSCESEVAGSDQINENAQAMRDARNGKL